MKYVTEKRTRDREALHLLLEAYRVYAAGGEPTTRCDLCGGIIVFQQLGDDAYQSDCPCGKYHDIIRGI
jgi:hypothetical protein